MLAEDPKALSLTGGSLLIAWQLKDKHVLIVGGGEVASQRIESILTADAFITVLSPVKGLHPRTKELIERRPERITHYDRRFTNSSELHKVDMVLTAIDDVKRSGEIVEMCRKARIPVNAADIPDCCDFYFGAQIRDGPLQIMISTNGNGPRMASLIKIKLKDSLSGNEGAAITKVGQLREKLKERAPGTGGALGRQRMKWMTQLCNTWGMDDFCLLDDAMMAQLLDEGWENGRVPAVEDVVGTKSRKSLPSKHNPRTQTEQLGFLLSSSLGFVAGAVFVVAVSLYHRR